MKVKRNRFDNRCMTPRNERKPHLALIEGLWRVSPKPHEAYSNPSLQRLWTMAHYWANSRNEKIWGLENDLRRVVCSQCGYYQKTVAKRIEAGASNL